MFKSRSATAVAVLVAVCTFLTSFNPANAQSGDDCTAKHKFVGFSGTLSPNFGIISIPDDCSFKFTVNEEDASAVEGFSWGGLVSDNGNFISLGFSISRSLVSATPLPVRYLLRSNITFNDFDFITLVSTVTGNEVASIRLRRPRSSTTSTTTTTTVEKPSSTTTEEKRSTTTTAATVTTSANTTEVVTTVTFRVATTSTSTATATATRTPAATLRNITGPLVIKTGPNPNYPGLLPTVLNISLYVNDVESPVVELERGKTYTFSIQAGQPHPVYFTTSREGGGPKVSNGTETIFLGNSSTFGTASQPFVMNFTPTSEHPDSFFYQCYVHRRMGWKIVLINSTATTTTTPASGASTSKLSGFMLISAIIATLFAVFAL